MKTMLKILIGTFLINFIAASLVASDFHIAVKNADIVMIKTMLEKNPDLAKQPDENGNLPLHFAASAGNMDILNLLITFANNVNVQNNFGQTPLINATNSKQSAIVQSLIGRGANVNAKTNNQWTALHSASMFGFKDIVELLIKSGADVNARDNLDDTPLNLATYQSHDDVVELLRCSGAVYGEKKEADVMTITNRITRLSFPYQGSPNIFIYTRSNGLLLIDTGTRETASKLHDTLEGLYNSDVKYIISTHNHGDHRGGNSISNDNTILLNYDNLNEQVDNGILLRKKKEPINRVFNNYYSFGFNGEEINIYPCPGTHSSSDMIIFFSQSKIVFMGDLVMYKSFPAISGELKNYMDIIEETIKIFPKNARFFGGHGPEYSMEYLKKHFKEIKTTLEIVHREKKAGKNLEEIMNLDVWKKWESWKGFACAARIDSWIRYAFLNEE